MTDYSPLIAEHFMNPRNVGQMDDPDVTAFVGNPVCGDQIYLYAHIQDNRITECTFLAYGCVASLATASILTETITGQPVDALDAFDEAHIVELVGGLSPTQRHCATIGQDVLRSLAHNYRTGTTDGLAGSPLSCQ